MGQTQRPEELPEMTTYYADATWDSDSISVFQVSEDAERRLASGTLEWVDPDDDSTEAHNRRRAVITEALSALGWAPEPDAEWVHIEGGLGSEAGGERIPVQPA
jgi:hypothetical protein